MFNKRLLALSIAFSLVGCSAGANKAVELESATLTGDEVISTSAGEIVLEHNYIVDRDVDKLFDEMDYQRASQAYIWSTPAVSFMRWKIDQEAKYGTKESHQFAVFESLKEKRGVVTGNLTTPYIINFHDLANGPLEIEYPAGATAGGFLDLWQRPVADIGLTGPDAGKGGTYIIVGPSDNVEKYKKEGVHVFQSETNFLFLGLRLIDPSPEFAEKFKQELKIGLVGSELKSAVFYENVDAEWNGTAPRGLEYWEYLSEIVNNEPVRQIDKPWMAMLAPLGIEKGKAFTPTATQKKNLEKGAAMGELMLRNMQTNPRFAEPYWDNTSWYKSFDFLVSQENENMQQVDERGVWFYEAVTSTEGMVNPTVGKGQVYMTSKRDSEGRLLRADKTYKLHVPAGVPVGQFWSLILYSEETRRPYDNGGLELKDVGKNSRDESLQYNEDGSIDLYIGAKAPKGKESNYLKTVGEDGWFVYFRLYAPLEGFFDKSFKLDDFERID